LNESFRIKLGEYKLRKLLFIGLVSLFFTACSINRTVVTNEVKFNGSNNNASNAGKSDAPKNDSAKTESSGTPKPAATDEDDSPKRIAFGKGQSSAAENMTLAPGESKKFVFGASEGQMIGITSSAAEAKIRMITKGKVEENSNEPGFYNATLTGDGDFIFEVSNPTKKEFKTSVNLIIGGGEDE
jgi:hypothetical protein